MVFMTLNPPELAMLAKIEATKQAAPHQGKYATNPAQALRCCRENITAE